MATQIEYIGKCGKDKITGKAYPEFKTDKGDHFFIKSLQTTHNSGIATIVPSILMDIFDVSEMAAGCFEDESNFKEEMLKAFGRDPDTPFTAIMFKFNEKKILVTREIADKNKIVNEYMNSIHK